VAILWHLTNILIEYFPISLWQDCRLLSWSPIRQLACT